MDFIKIKKIIIFVLALPALYLIASNMSLIFNRPDIKNLNVPNMADISFNSNSKELISNTEAINNIPSFDYQLIGYRSGKNDSSVILKKGNKEYVVAKGEKLEGTYELIEVTKDEVIFRNKEKLYRIENRVGNNWLPAFGGHTPSLIPALSIRKILKEANFETPYYCLL